MRNFKVLFALAAWLGLGFCGAIPAHAATTRTVNSALDHDGTCDAVDCTLREAISASAPGDTIRFAFSGTLLITLGELGIGRDLTIIGPADGSLHIERDAAAGIFFRVFHVTAGTVKIYNLTIGGGYAQGNPGTPGNASTPNGGDGGEASGGGILNSGTLTLTHCTVAGNSVLGGDGGSGYDAANGYGGNGGNAFGAGIANLGSLTLSRCTVYSNLATGGVGGFCQLPGQGGAGGGGGISNSGALVMTNSTVYGNITQGGAGGDSSSATEGDGGNGGFSAGAGVGEITSGMGGAPVSLFVTNCTISGNSAYGGNGGRGGANATGGDGGSSQGGGLFADNIISDSSKGLRNTLIALNNVSGGAGGAGGTPGFPGGPGGPFLINAPDVVNQVNSFGHNFVGKSDGSNGWIASDLLGSVAAPLNPQLGMFADNGGLTQTLLLLPGSAAINAGDDAALSAPLSLTTDQRDLPRKLGAHVDIGATEFDPSQTSVTLVVNTLDDHNDGACGTADCTLPEAVNAANANADVSTINFKTGLTGTIVLTTALNITQPVNISGPGASILRISGNSGFQVFIIAVGKTANISGLTVLNGIKFQGQMGAVLNNGTLTLSACVFSNNISLENGGAIFNQATLTVRDCTFSGNKATSSGGALFSMSGATATISGSTFSGNSAGYGAAILNEDMMTVTNCTFSGNTATNSGGAILNNGGTLVVQSCTISGNTVTTNSADYGGGGIDDQGATGPHIANSIIAGNTGPNGPDLHGIFTSDGFNLIGKNAGNTGFSNGVKADQVGTAAAPFDAKLDTLKNNGGPTFTRTPLAGSRAIDKGKKFGLTTDQRGFNRPVDNAAIAPATGGDNSDIGAFEVGGIPALSVNNPRSLDEGSAAAPGSITFDITLNAASLQTVTVGYQTLNGTNNPATAGSDYVAKSGTLTFAPGETLKRVTVQFIGDSVVEPTETFFFDLKTPTAATIFDSRGVGTIRNDD